MSWWRSFWSVFKSFFTVTVKPPRGSVVVDKDGIDVDLETDPSLEIELDPADGRDDTTP